MNMKIKPHGAQPPLTDFSSAKSASGTDKSQGEFKLEKKPGLWSRLRSFSEAGRRAAGLGRAKMRAESAVPKARFTPIKQQVATAQGVGPSVSMPATLAGHKRVSFGKPPSEPPPMPPQAPSTAGRADAAAPKSVKGLHGWTVPSEAPPKPPAQASDDEGLDSAIDGMLNALNAHDADASFINEMNSLVNEINSAMALEKSPQELESPGKPPNTKT